MLNIAVIMHRKNSVIGRTIRHYLLGNSMSLTCYWGYYARPLLLGDPYFSVRIISTKILTFFSGLYRIISDRKWAHTVSPS